LPVNDYTFCVGHRLYPKKRWNKRFLFLAVTSLILAGCSAPSKMTMQADDVAPKQWVAQPESLPEQQATPLENWLDQLESPALKTLIEEGVKHSPTLKAAKAELDQSYYSLIGARADRFPLVSLSLSGDRPESSDSSVSLSTSISWNPDIWGALSAAQKKAQLDYASAEATYRYERLTLIQSIANAWFDLSEAQMLLDLYQKQASNLESDLKTIEEGYRLGLYEALDLYLAKNDVNAQLAQVKQSEQSVLEAKRELEQLVGRYPEGALAGGSDLPVLPALSINTLPAQVISERPDLNAAWLNVLAADQSLAVAYRNRFPSFQLTGRYGGSSDSLSSVVDSGVMAWTLGASLAYTVFDAGNLKAQQQSAESNRVALENNYLNDVFGAFKEVENALSAQETLNHQYALYEAAKENALQAEDLSFEQYQRGLEEYTTVLEAQRRSISSQTNLISVKKSLLQNRINLAVALGATPELFEDAYPDMNSSTVETSLQEGTEQP
jgi:multidrug efflux system outer membrane protein